MRIRRKVTTETDAAPWKQAQKFFDVWCPACGSHAKAEPNWTLMSEVICENCGQETVVTWQTGAAKAKNRV